MLLLENVILYNFFKDAYNLDVVGATQWGRTHQKDGLDALKTNLKVEILSTGIWLSNSGLLGTSTNGLVGDDAVMEVKCPYALQNDLLSEKMKNNFKYFIRVTTYPKVQTTL